MCGFIIAMSFAFIKSSVTFSFFNIMLLFPLTSDPTLTFILLHVMYASTYIHIRFLNQERALLFEIAFV